MVVHDNEGVQFGTVIDAVVAELKTGNVSNLFPLHDVGMSEATSREETDLTGRHQVGVAMTVLHSMFIPPRVSTPRVLSQRFLLSLNTAGVESEGL